MGVDSVKLKGRVRFVLRNAAGKVILDQTVYNLVTTIGLGHIASRMVGVAQGIMSYMGIGSGNTAAAAGQTTLETELARVVFDSYTASGVDVTAVATFAAGVGTGTVREAALLNASSAGTMLNRAVLAAAITKAATDSLTISWEVSLSDG